MAAGTDVSPRSEAHVRAAHENARARLASPFAEVRPRATLDYALRTVQQTQNQLSSMADTKASIMITVCSIVLTVGITRFETPILRWPLVLLTGSVLASLLFAVLAVLPTVGAPRRPDGSVDVDSSAFNLVFFGHFSELPPQRFEEMLADVAREDWRIYDMLTRDIYGLGTVLARKKYRMLRWSYITFFVGLFVTALGAIATMLVQMR